jgi:dipeptidyl aminopeptidase/acylaminoacyl peptidase
VDGGEAIQLTDFSGGVSGADWLGHSGDIIFSSMVYPECGADDSCNKAIQQSADNGPLNAHLADKLLYRHWTSYRDGKYSHIIKYNPQSKTYSDLTPGNYDAPDMFGSFDVSADGKYLCYESNHDKNEAQTTNKDLFLTEIAGGKTINLTSANKAYDGSPKFSPDGTKIAYITQKITGFESDLKRLAVYDLRKKSAKIVSGEIDNWVNDFQWSPDSKDIYFTIHEKGRFPLYKVSLKNGKIKKLFSAGTIDNFILTPKTKEVILTRRTIAEPSEIFSAKMNGKLQRLTYFNQAAEKRVDIRPAEEFWIESPSGAKIHTFVIKPHNFDPNKKYPLIVNVHGGPQYQWMDSFRGDWQVYPGAGYIVAFPNPHGSTGYGQEFTNAISKDWQGKVYDDVMAVTDYLAGLDYVDEKRIGAMGWSYGGYFMMWLEGHNPNKRFKALAAMMGLYDLPAFYGATEELWFPEWDLGDTPWDSDLYEKYSPHNYVKNFATPCLVITGEKDYRVPYTQSLEFFTALQKRGVDSRLIVFPDDGHWPDYVKSMPFYYNAHLDWFHKYLGGGQAPYDMKKMLRNQAFEK